MCVDSCLIVGAFEQIWQKWDIKRGLLLLFDEGLSNLTPLLALLFELFDLLSKTRKFGLPAPAGLSCALSVFEKPVLFAGQDTTQSIHFSVSNALDINGQAAHQNNTTVFYFLEYFC